MQTVRSNLKARSRKESTQGPVAIQNEKKNVQGCVSQNTDPMNSILWKAGNEIERFGGTHHEILEMHLVRN